MLYSKCENEHDHIINSSETDEKDAWKHNVALMCPWFQHVDQGKLGPKSLRTEGWNQPIKLSEGKDFASDLYRALYMGSTEKKTINFILCLKIWRQLYASRKSSHFLKSTLARTHGTTQIANILKGSLLWCWTSLSYRYRAQEDCCRFSFYLFLIFSATS